jgi:hypothetical protein
MLHHQGKNIFIFFAINVISAYSLFLTKIILLGQASRPLLPIV